MVYCCILFYAVSIATNIFDSSKPFYNKIEKIYNSHQALILNDSFAKLTFQFKNHGFSTVDKDERMIKLSVIQYKEQIINNKRVTEEISHRNMRECDGEKDFERTKYE